jgi:hypothetical protein
VEAVAVADAAARAVAPVDAADRAGIAVVVVAPGRIVEKGAISSRT